MYYYRNFVTEVNCYWIQNALIGEITECDFRAYVLNILKASRNGASVDDSDEVRLNIFHSFVILKFFLLISFCCF